MKSYKIEARKTARYFVLNPSVPNGQLIFALHGYGHLAQYFIKKLEILAELGYTVVAPEGLSRYYLLENSGRVGASWMTKEAREDDIADTISYLEELGVKIKALYGQVRWHLFGFSQGAATACRWAAASKFRFETLTLYASFFPPDFDFGNGLDKLSRTRTIVTLGDKDGYMSENELNEKLIWLRDKGIEPQLIVFNGGHEIINDVLKGIYSR